MQFSLERRSRRRTITNVAFDLAEMGATPRTMSNVVVYLNGKLEAAGVATRFANVRTPGVAADRSQAGGQSVPLGTSPDTFSLQIKGVGAETLDLLGSDARPRRVYLGGAMGGSATAPGRRR